MMKIKTPNKKKRKSMAVLKEEITVCENVPNKVENCEEEISELLNKTKNIKKKKSIAVVNEKIAISEGNASVEQTEMNDKSVIKSKTPSKTGKKKRKSIAVVQETSVDSKEDVFAEATEVVKDNSMMKIKTPNKKKRKSMAVLKEEITVCENIPNKAEHCEEEISELLNKTKNIKKKKSIAVVNKKNAISNSDASVEQTEMNDKAVIDTKTPSKTGKKKRKSIAVGHGTSTVPKENVFAQATEVVKDKCMMQMNNPSKKITKHSYHEMIVSNKIGLAEDAELFDESANKSKILTKKIKRKSALVKIGDTEKNKLKKEDTKENVKQNSHPKSDFQKEKIANKGAQSFIKCQGKSWSQVVKEAKTPQKNSTNKVQNPIVRHQKRRVNDLLNQVYNLPGHHINSPATVYINKTKSRIADKISEKKITTDDHSKIVVTTSMKSKPKLVSKLASEHTDNSNETSEIIPTKKLKKIKTEIVENINRKVNRTSKKGVVLKKGRTVNRRSLGPDTFGMSRVVKKNCDTIERSKSNINDNVFRPASELQAKTNNEKVVEKKRESFEAQVPVFKFSTPHSGSPKIMTTALNVRTPNTIKKFSKPNEQFLSVKESSEIYQKNIKTQVTKKSRKSFFEEKKNFINDNINAVKHKISEQSKVKKQLKSKPKDINKSSVTDNFGMKRLKTPKIKMQSGIVGKQLGLKRLLQTPKNKVKNEAVGENFGTKRLYQTPKLRVKIDAEVKENFGTKRLLK